MNPIAGTLTRPIGPLPLWAWGALGGGALILFAAHKGSGAAQAVLNPNNPGLTPTDTTGGGSTGGGTPPVVLQPGETTGAPVSFTDLLGGMNLLSFLQGLGPNYSQFQISAGGTGATVQNSAQNILDEQSALAAYHAAEVNNNNFYAAQVANNTNFWQAWASYWHDRPGFGPGVNWATGSGLPGPTAPTVNPLPGLR